MTLTQDATEGGDAVAGALAAACGDPEVLARLAGPLGEAACALLPARTDRMVRAGWAATARVAVPAGLRGVHASWIEAALVDLPPRAREAVAAAAAGGDATDVWLARSATAAFPPMHPASERRVTSVDGATRVHADVLERWIEDVGADQLVFSLRAAGPTAVNAAAWRAGKRIGEQLRVAAARIGVAPRAGALGPLRAAIARCQVALDEQALLRIGARAVAPHLDPLARLRITYRLPRPIGTIVGDEMAASARQLLTDAPTWAALAA